jgi:hypothetical protein
MNHEATVSGNKEGGKREGAERQREEEKVKKKKKEGGGGGKESRYREISIKSGVYVHRVLLLVY